jgi:hypothetical protein
MTCKNLHYSNNEFPNNFIVYNFRYFGFIYETPVLHQNIFLHN